MDWKAAGAFAELKAELVTLVPSNGEGTQGTARPSVARVVGQFVWGPGI